MHKITRKRKRGGMGEGEGDGRREREREWGRRKWRRERRRWTGMSELLSE